MRVRSVYSLKRFPSLEEAQKYASKIKNGAGKHCDCELEIHWDEKGKTLKSLSRPKALTLLPVPPEEKGEVETDGQWSVVVVDDTPPPGGKPCAECEQPHYADDYLCPDCRAVT